MRNAGRGPASPQRGAAAEWGCERRSSARQRECSPRDDLSTGEPLSRGREPTSFPSHRRTLSSLAGQNTAGAGGGFSTLRERSRPQLLAGLSSHPAAADSVSPTVRRRNRPGKGTRLANGGRPNVRAVHKQKKLFSSFSDVENTQQGVRSSKPARGWQRRKTTRLERGVD